MMWKYSMILVDNDHTGEVCELVRLYKRGDEYVFEDANISSPDDLFLAAQDVEKDGVNREFYDTGTFKREYDDTRSEWVWSWRKDRQYDINDVDDLYAIFGGD